MIKKHKIFVLQTGLLIAGLVVVTTFQACGGGFNSALNLSSLPIADLPLGDESFENPPSSNPFVLSAACKTSTIDQMTVSSNRRMLKPELQTSYIQLFGSAFMNQSKLAGLFDAISDEVRSEDSVLPATPDLPFEGLLSIADTVGDTIAADKMKNVSSPNGCNGSNSSACLNWVLNIAEGAFKRKLETVERTDLTSFFNAQGLASTIKRILISPQFVMHLELSTAANAGLRRLTPEEVASRIAFQTTGGLPDKALLDAAQSGQLETAAQVKAHVERLMTTPLARRKVRQTFQEWLDVDRVPDPSPLFASLNQINSTGFGEEAKEEFGRFIEYIVFDKRGGFQDLMTDKTVFPYTDRLALNTGVSKSSSAQSFRDFRGGILMRPASLVSSGTYTSPIQRGVYFRKYILCEKIPPPSDDILVTRTDELVNMDRSQFSSRHIVTEVTKGSCMGCHNMINPLGYTLEGIDPFGMPRSTEKIFDSTGKIVAEHAIDTTVEDLFLNNGSGRTPASSPEDLTRHIANSPKAITCMTQTLVQSARVREMSTHENCVGEHLAVDVSSGQSIYQTLINSIASEDIFWVRK